MEILKEGRKNKNSTYKVGISWLSGVSDLGLTVQQVDNTPRRLDTLLEVRCKGKRLRS